MPAELPSDLRAELDAFLAKKPDSRELIDKLLKKRAEGTEEEAVKTDKMLRWLIKPSSGYVGWGIFGAAFLLLAVCVARDQWTERAEAEALARSTPAVALVKRMDPGDCFTTPEQARCLQLELEVHLPKAAPYTATLTHIVDVEWLSRVQPGSWLTVGVSPEDRNVVLFDERAMAVAAPAPPSE